MLVRTISAVLVIGGVVLLTTPRAGSQNVVPVKASQPGPNSVSDEDIALMRKDLRDQKKQIVAANLPLTGDEAEKFWPLYDQYTAETIKINDQRYALVKGYAENYQSITDEQASDYIRKWLAVDQDATKLRLEYIPRFEKILPAKKVATFFQIDRRLGLMIEIQLSSWLPLASGTN